GKREADDREEATPDAGREVVDQHLEAGADLALPQRVELLHRPAAERPHDHRAEEHRHAGTGDGADRCDRPHDPASDVVVVHHPAAGVADQEWQQIGDHRPDDAGAVRTLAPRAEVLDDPVAAVIADPAPYEGDPSGLDEQGRDQAPGDERGDVGQDHVRQELAEPLDVDPHATTAGGRLCCCGHGRPSSYAGVVPPVTDIFDCVYIESNQAASSPKAHIFEETSTQTGV